MMDEEAVRPTEPADAGGNGLENPQGAAGPDPEGPGSRRNGGRRSLQFYLLALVLAVMGPLLAFSSVMIIRSASFEREATRQYLADSTMGLSLDMDREITALQAVATTLVGSRRIDERDFAGLQQTLARSVPMQGAWFEFSDRSGQQLVNTRLPFGAAMPRIDREIVGRVFATGKLALSNLYRSELTHSPVISISAPIIRGGDVVYVLSLVVPA